MKLLVVLIFTDGARAGFRRFEKSKLLLPYDIVDFAVRNFFKTATSSEVL